jgi:membrane protein DedA with SNARE-associated domain
MPDDIVLLIAKYGYLAIFILIFLQEIGMPNPFPNELLLIFSGYLVFKGVLFLPYLLLTCVLADFIGTCLLYFLFSKSGEFILANKPRWIPISSKTIHKLSLKINSRGLYGVFIFRLTPFTRGYASVISGLLQIKTKPFLTIALGSALTWSTVYIIIGYIIGPYWSIFLQNILNFKYIMISVILFAMLIIFIVFRFSKARKTRSDQLG